MLMLNSILRACIQLAVHAGSLYVNTTISVVFTFGVAAAELALGGVAVAEAGCAAELVVGVDEEVTGLASVATLAFDVLLAVAVAGGVVAARRVGKAPFQKTSASLAPEASEVPVVDLAL